MAERTISRTVRMFPMLPTVDPNQTALAEYALLSLPPGSALSVSDLLSDFPLQYVEFLRRPTASPHA